MAKIRRFNIYMYGLSDSGLVRPNNQDSYWINSNQNACIVADGIGGRKGGKEASQLACESLSEFYMSMRDLKGDEFHPFIRSALDRANMNIFELGQKNENLEGMGTTLESLLILDGRVYISHIGDSRTYLFYNNHLWQLTLDHNINAFIERGWIDQNKLYKDFKGGALVRALGLSDECEIDIYEKNILPGEVYVSATDGLFDMVKNTRILQIIKDSQYELKKIPELLVKEANKSGGKDNITVVVTGISG